MLAVSTCLDSCPSCRRTAALTAAEANKRDAKLATYKKKGKKNSKFKLALDMKVAQGPPTVQDAREREREREREYYEESRSPKI